MLTNILAETPLILAASSEIKKKYLGRMIEEPLMAVSVFSNCSTFIDNFVFKLI